MVAFNSRGDHFIPPPVSQAAVLEALRRGRGEPFRSPVPLPYSGRWGSAPPDFSSLLSLHHCKEEVGEILKRGQSPLFPYTGRPATNEVCLALVRQADAGSVLSARALGREAPNWDGWVGNVWIKGVACRFSFVAFLLPSQKKSGRVQSGSL